MIALALLALSSNSTTSVAVRADKVWLGDGRTLEKALIVVEHGKFERIESQSNDVGDLEVIEHKGVLTSGLIALRTQLGLGGDSSDEARSALPDAQVGWSYAPDSRDFDLARAAGVTTVVLVPESPGVCSGLSAVVKTAGRSVLAPRANLVLGLGGEALGFNTEPTSFSGQLALLDELFAGKSDPVEQAKQHQLSCYFGVSTRADILRAIGFAKKHDLRGALVGAYLSGEVAEEIHAAKLSVVLPAIGLGVDRRELKAALELSKKGIAFGFAGDGPSEPLSKMRLSAALLVREGLSVQAAWTALTSDAARIAGVGERVGRVAAGLDADFVLWSGDPLDLASRIVAVYVDGRRVAGGEQ